MNSTSSRICRWASVSTSATMVNPVSRAIEPLAPQPEIWDFPTSRINAQSNFTTSTGKLVKRARLLLFFPGHPGQSHHRPLSMPARPVPLPPDSPFHPRGPPNPEDECPHPVLVSRHQFKSRLQEIIMKLFHANIESHGHGRKPFQLRQHPIPELKTGFRSPGRFTRLY